jgi:short-subunit dehydrogenase
MVEHRRGYIVNVASMLGLVPGSSGPLYSPAKSLLIDFSRCLNLELSGSGVHVSAVCPGFTRTEFFTVAGTSVSAAKIPAFAWRSPERVAADGYDMGMLSAICVTGWFDRGLVAGAPAGRCCVRCCPSYQRCEITR